MFVGGFLKDNQLLVSLAPNECIDDKAAKQVYLANNQANREYSKPLSTRFLRFDGID
jgi:hypothetical protein